MPAIGVDIGGTKLAIGVVDDEGILSAYRQMPLPTSDYRSLVSAISALVQDYRVTQPGIASLGLAVASWLSPDRNEVLQAVNLGWDRVSLRADLEAATGLPTIMNNDADCAAWAEYRAIAAQLHEAFVLLTLGTDVGGGVIVNGQLLTGAFGIAGELGHLKVGLGDVPCVCGSVDCLAAYASGRAMVSLLNRLRRERDADLAALDGAGFKEAVDSGDQLALEVLDRTSRAIAAASAQISRVVDHRYLVLGGGASGIGATLTAAVNRNLAETPAIGPVRPIPSVSIASTGNRAGVLGAAQLANRQLQANQQDGEPHRVERRSSTNA